jgi:hypothetical protein
MDMTDELTLLVVRQIQDHLDPGQKATASQREKLLGERRQKLATRLRMEVEKTRSHSVGDPLLTTLAGLRHQRLEAEMTSRLLVAYGREFVRPRPYRLIDLAEAAGMSISGIRTAYGDDEIDQVAKALGRKPVEGRE